MKKFLTFILVCLLLISCSKHKGLQVYKTTDKNGYCFFNDGLWYLYYMNQSTGQYYYYGATSNFNAYNNSSTVDWTPTAENVSNFSETPTEVTEVITESMSEANGESVGGTDVNNTSDGNGMSEDSGQESGGADSNSDSGSGDSGGGDSGGGDSGGE